MRTWELTLGLDPESAGEPLFRRIASVIAQDIERGRLRPGERLSSTRILAQQLGVNRNTLVAAFDTLRREGWIDGRSRSGSFVAAHPPTCAPDGSVGAPPAGFDLPEGPRGQRPARRGPDTRLLLGGVPDMRLVPTRALASAYSAALRGLRGRRALDYGDPQGTERLRGALAHFLTRTRGIPTRPEGVAVVRGSQQGLYLVAQTLIRPGDRVAVEAIGFPPGWEALRLAGATLVPIPVDADGIDVAAVESAHAASPLRAVLVTPHHQYPTTVTLSAARRKRLLSFAARHRVVVVEDDYDFEFHYEGPPVLPLAAQDPHHVVVYVATMSKTLAPGLRLGYVAAHPEVVARVGRYRSLVDHQGDHLVEHAVATLIEDGEVQRHTRRTRRIYGGRRDALVEALRRHLPDLVFTVPRGGMALWARAPGVDTTAWAQRAAGLDVAFQAGGPLHFAGGADDHLRLGFAACNEIELVDAVQKMARCRAPTAAAVPRVG